MPGAFSPILSPPQSIDSIDAWGDLDDLPYSLDSTRWDVIGLYKIVVTDVVRTTETGQGQRTRTDAIGGSAVAAGTADGDALLDVEGMGIASSGEDSVGGITVVIPVEPAAGSSEQLLLLWRVRPDNPGSGSVPGELLYPYRIRTQSLVSGTHTGGEADVWRVLMLTCAGVSISGGEVWPEYKGWAWTREAQMEQGWSPILGTEQDWRQIPGSMSDWRGIVEWQ